MFFSYVLPVESNEHNDKAQHANHTGFWKQVPEQIVRGYRLKVWFSILSQLTDPCL